MGSRQPERSIPDVRDVFQRFHQPQRILEEDSAPRGSNNKLKGHRNNNNHYGGQEVESLSGGSSNNNSSSAATKGLTESDLKHIERHLSMKKTIRKQLSRHLSKAFVEDKPPPDSHFLDMLKSEGEEGVANQMAPPTRQISSTSSSSRNGSSNLESAMEPTKKSNFWKKLTIRSRSKR